MTMPVVGLDIGKSKVDVALLSDGKIRNKVCQNNAKGAAELLGWLQRQRVQQAHICMEATGGYGEELALTLVDAGHVVSIVNPARIKGFGQSELVRTKTDRSDAGLIARFCAAMNPEPWVPPAPEVRELRALVRRLDTLTEMCQQENNRLEFPSASEDVKAGIEAHITYLETEIAETEKAIRSLFKRHDGLRGQRDLLTSIPGIAEKTAAVILAEIRCISDFESARQLAAYAGLTPAEFISGTSIRRHTRLSKRGNWRLRKALYMPGIVAMTHNPIIREFCERLIAKGMSRAAAVGAAMRKLLHQAYGVLTTGTKFTQDIAVLA